MPDDFVNRYSLLATHLQACANGLIGNTPKNQRQITLQSSSSECGLPDNAAPDSSFGCPCSCFFALLRPLPSTVSAT